MRRSGTGGESDRSADAILQSPCRQIVTISGRITSADGVDLLGEFVVASVEAIQKSIHFPDDLSFVAEVHIVVGV